MSEITREDFNALIKEFSDRTESNRLEAAANISEMRKETAANISEIRKETAANISEMRKEVREDREKANKSIKWTVGVAFTIFGMLMASLNIVLKFI